MRSLLFLRQTGDGENYRQLVIGHGATVAYARRKVAAELGIPVRSTELLVDGARITADATPLAELFPRLLEPDEPSADGTVEHSAGAGKGEAGVAAAQHEQITVLRTPVRRHTPCL